MDITNKNVEQLKAIAYDLLIQSQINQNNLQSIHKQIELKVQEVKVQEAAKEAEKSKEDK